MARPVKWRVTIGRDFLRNPDLSPPEKSVILALASYADFHLRSSPTKAELCAAAGVSPRGLWRHLAKMRGKYVNFEERRIQGRLRIIYTLLSPCQIGMMDPSKFSVPNLRDGNTVSSVPNWHGDENLTISTRAPASFNGSAMHTEDDEQPLDERREG